MIRALNKRYWLWIFLLYSLVVITLTLDYNSAYVDEVRNIFMGQKVIAGQPCYLCKQYTGSVMVEPVLAALGDYYGSIYGARVVSIFFGLGLTVIIYTITQILFEGEYALISAMLFLFSGTALYLSKLATSDIVSAFFLGLAFLLLLLGEQNKSLLRKSSFFFTGAAALTLSAMTNYVAAVFIPAFIIYAFLKNGFFYTLSFFLIPLVIFTSLYGYFAIYPVSSILAWTLTSVYDYGHVPFRTLSSWTMRWMAMPYLLSIFGIFHEDKGKIALMLFAFSTPIILLHLFTGVDQSLSRDVIFSQIFLAPAAAVGVDHLGNIFSFKSPNPWVKPFFLTAILIVLWVFGFQELRWLEKQYPDMTPVINFFREKGFNGMTVAVDSNYGVSVYTYSLEPYYPQAKFLSVQEIDPVDSIGHPLSEKVNFIVFDGYYGKSDLRNKALPYLQNGFFLMKNFKLPVSWGTTDIKIFGRRKT